MIIISPTVNKFFRMIPLLLVVLLSVLFLFPIYWMIVGSFKKTYGIYEMSRSLLPIDMTMENYFILFKRPILRWFFNSTFIAFCTALVAVITNSMAGYSLAKKKFYGSKIVFWLVVGTLMLPRQVLIVPSFLQMTRMKFYGTYLAFMLPSMGWPLGVFLMTQFMKSLPNELIESARIDGHNELGIFFKIVLPLAKPGIGALGIFTFINVWGDYLWQLVVTPTYELTTLPVGIAGLITAFTVTDYGIASAGATISAVPIIIVFIRFQKYFTRGITLGALKG